MTTYTTRGRPFVLSSQHRWQREASPACSCVPDPAVAMPAFPPAQVAILCNHQRSVPKGHQGQMEKLQEKLAAIQEEIDVSPWMRLPVHHVCCSVLVARGTSRQQAELEEP